MTVNDILFFATAYVTLFVSVFWFVTYFLSEKKQNIAGVLPSLSIIVPVYNEKKTVAKCIDSLLKQEYPNLKVIVVDDGSTDGTGGIVRKFAGVKYVKKSHSGKAASLNAGLSLVRTELFGFIDSDTFLSENALKNMVGYVEGKNAAVIATIKPYKPKKMIEKIQHVEYVVSSFTRKLMSFLDSLYYTPGFAIYRTSVIRKIGGFDENNISEDLEIGLRLKNNGYNIQNSVADCAYTIVPKTFRGLFKQRMRWYRGYIYNSRKYKHMFFNRKYSDLGILILPLQYLLLSLIIPFFLFAIYDNAVALARGLSDAYVVGFDVQYLISRSSFTPITPTTFYLAATLIAFIFMIKLSEKNVRDKISKMDYAIYIILYPFINLILWISAFAYEITKAKKEW